MEETHLWPGNADDKAVAGGRGGQIFFGALGVRGLASRPTEDAAGRFSRARKLCRAPLELIRSHLDLNRNVL